MKNFLLLSAGIFLLSGLNTTFAKSYAAVDFTGNCQNYESLESVPEGYKVIPSCDLIKKESSNISMREKLKLRLRHRFSRSKSAQNSTKKTELNAEQNAQTQSRKGSGSLTKRRGYLNRRLITNKQVSHFDKKTRTVRNYSKKTRKFINKLRNKGGYQLDGDTTAAERSKRRLARSRQGSATQIDRTSSLSNTPKFSTEMKKRRSYHRASTAQKRWKSASTLKREAMKKARDKRKEVRKNRSQRGLVLRQTWKGERLNGSLDQELTSE